MDSDSSKPDKTSRLSKSGRLYSNSIPIGNFVVHVTEEAV